MFPVRFARLIQRSSDGDNGGGGGSQGQPPTGSQARIPRLSRDEVLQRFERDPEGTADHYRDLERDGRRYRQKIDTLEDQAAALAKRQTPEGAIVLTSQDAALWAEYRKLGEPADLSTKLSTAETAASELASLRRERHMADVASSTGWNARVLAHLAADRQIELRDEQGEQGPTKRAYIKDGDQFHPADDFARQHWADFLPSLSGSQQGNGQPPATPPTPRVPYPPQGATQSGTTGDLVGDYLARREPARTG